MNSTHKTYLSLGSNLGNRLSNLQQAIYQISRKVGRAEKISSVYETASWGFDSDDFYNICIRVSTTLDAAEVMHQLLAIEATFGRKRSESGEYLSREIDLDILLFDSEVIISEEVTVPHPRMLDRKFVLIPLAEIAPDAIHPITNSSIRGCLSNCTDDSEVHHTSHILERPLVLSEKYNYVAIEGNIGAGKTTLANLLSEKHNARTVFERFAENPFLPKFYEDPDRYAFPLEMSFLADRYQQLSEDLAQMDLFQNFVISDYYIFKSLIFAQITLQKDEMFLYRKMFDIMYKEITKPDLYVYLYQHTERLLENIKKRGRSYEQNIEASYLQKIHDGYKNFIDSQREYMNVLVIDVSELDFVSNPADLEVILEKLQ